MTTADAVDPQAALMLEGLHRGPGARAEDAVVIDGRARDLDGQPAL
ncbi:MAG TPA: hypothetical protein VGL48_12485 [Acidimicrobiales bacterium]